MTAHTETDLQPLSMTAREPRAATKEAWDFTGQGTILLVEDEQSLRSLIARGLRLRDYSVIKAANGVEALEALEQRRACRKTSRFCRSRSGSASLSQ